jgi:predicted O-methyltransferase YrrM
VQSLGVEEAILIKRLVAELPTRPVIVNIGAAAGASTMAMLEERPDDLFIFSIDVDPNCGELIELGKAGLAQLNRVVRLLGKSGEIGEHFPIPVDLVYVDGDHTAEGVKADLMHWMWKIRHGGILICHDYHSPSLHDVKQVVDELVRWPVIADVETIRAFRRE